MQAAKTLVDKALSQPSIKSDAPSPSDKLSQSNMDKLWLKMAELYGIRWTGSFGASADQTHAWATVLGGLTGQQIANGLSILSATQDQQLRKWPPAAPEFRCLCENKTPEAHNLPTMDQAYREATRNAHPSMAGITKWSHGVVYHAATETGFYNLNNLPMDVSRKLFERNYTITVRDYLDGKPLKAMPLALPEKVDGRSTPAVGRAALDAMRCKVKGGEAHG